MSNICSLIFTLSILNSAKNTYISHLRHFSIGLSVYRALHNLSGEHTQISHCDLSLSLSLSPSHHHTIILYLLPRCSVQALTRYTYTCHTYCVTFQLHNQLRKFVTRIEFLPFCILLHNDLSLKVTSVSTYDMLCTPV